MAAIAEAEMRKNIDGSDDVYHRMANSVGAFRIDVRIGDGEGEGGRGGGHMTLQEALAMAGQSTWALYPRDVVDAALSVLAAEIRRRDGQTCATCGLTVVATTGHLACANVMLRGVNEDDGACVFFGPCGAWRAR